MKSYTWTYNEDVIVHFSPKQALIRRTGEKDLVVRFRQPNEEHLGLYNAKLVADRLVELGYDLGGRKVLAIKAMRENVPFSAVLSEIKARREVPGAPKAMNGEYLIRIPRARDYQWVVHFMRVNKIEWR